MKIYFKLYRAKLLGGLLPALTLVCFASMAVAQVPCATNVTFNKGFILAALKSPKIDGLGEIISVSIERQSSVNGTVTINYGAGQRVKMNVEQKCDGSLAVSEPVSEYVCKKVVDCELELYPSEEYQKYCSEKYMKWAEKNCSERPIILN